MSSGLRRLEGLEDNAAHRGEEEPGAPALSRPLSVPQPGAESMPEMAQPQPQPQPRGRGVRELPPLPATAEFERFGLDAPPPIEDALRRAEQRRKGREASGGLLRGAGEEGGEEKTRARPLDSTHLEQLQRLRMGEEQAVLEDMHEIVTRLTSLGAQIGEELEQQNEILSDESEEIALAQHRINTLVVRMDALMNRTGCTYNRVIAFLSGLAAFLLLLIALS